MSDQRNLKTFVSKLIQSKPVEAFPHLYIVDKQTGPYRTIQDAIDAAEPHALIKISEGFYEENLIITKPLRLQPKILTEEAGRIGVVLLASAGVAVRVQLTDLDQQCEITGMKFSHSGNSDNSLKKELLQHEHMLNIFEHHESIDKPESEFVNRMNYNKMENIIVLLERGKTSIKNCIFSLNYLVKSCSLVIPALWIEKDAAVTLLGSEVKGNDTKDTIGIVCKLGRLHLENSIISKHRAGGILIWGVRNNNSKIIKNFIEDNSIGVHMVGEQFKLKIINNSINRNGVGVKVGLACEPDISRNIICENQQGIDVNSAFPNIALNKIEKNKTNGIICRSYKKYICKAIIRKNVGIASNKLNGIVIEGENNRTSVLNNHMVGFNGEAGVKVEKEAFPTISSNKIYKNYKEGILVVQNSNAMIEKNQITHNIECNIAIGGANSHHSVIVQNIIGDSPGSGICIIRSGKLKIIRNDISNNRDGLVLQDSQPELRRNYISENKNNGIVLEQKSNPIFIENFVTRNYAVGLLLRHRSGRKNSVLHSNIIVSNQIDVGMQEYDKQLQQQLTKNNTIQTDIYYPEGLPCQVM